MLEHAATSNSSKRRKATNGAAARAGLGAGHDSNVVPWRGRGANTFPRRTGLMVCMATSAAAHRRRGVLRPSEVRRAGAPAVRWTRRHHRPLPRPGERPTRTQAQRRARLGIWPARWLATKSAPGSSPRWTGNLRREGARRGRARSDVAGHRHAGAARCPTCTTGAPPGIRRVLDLVEAPATAWCPLQREAPGPGRLSKCLTTKSVGFRILDKTVGNGGLSRFAQVAPDPAADTTRHLDRRTPHASRPPKAVLPSPR